MTLELNLTDADRADKGFKEYFGSCITQRPLIISAGRIPMRVAHLMGMRILHPESDFMSNYFFCDDRIAHSSDNQRVKIGSRGILKPYEEHGVLVHGAMEFVEQKYNELPWKELQKSELSLGKWLSQTEAKTMSVWFESSQRNQQLLDVAVSVTYESGKFERAMGIYLDSGERANAWMGALYVDRLDDYRGLGASGGTYLDDDFGRLVGVAPEALVRLEKRLYDEKRIHVDFVRALTEGEGDVQGVPVRVPKADDISLAEGEQQYFTESEVDHALNFARESGQKDPEMILKIAREQLLNGRKSNE